MSSVALIRICYRADWQIANRVDLSYCCQLALPCRASYSAKLPMLGLLLLLNVPTTWLLASFHEPHWNILLHCSACCCCFLSLSYLPCILQLEFAGTKQLTLTLPNTTCPWITTSQPFIPHAFIGHMPMILEKYTVSTYLYICSLNVVVIVSRT